MSNTILHPPGADQPTLSTAVGHVHGGISIAGVSLNLFYTSEPLTHVVVGSTGDGNRRSWLGWATTAHPVTQAAVRGTGAQLGRELLAAMNSEVLCVGAIEELRRRIFAAQDESRRHNDAGRRELAAACDGEASALAGLLPLVCVLADRIVPGSAARRAAWRQPRPSVYDAPAGVDDNLAPPKRITINLRQPATPPTREEEAENAAYMARMMEGVEALRRAKAAELKEALGERAEVVILVMPGSMPAGDDGQALAATPS